MKAKMEKEYINKHGTPFKIIEILDDVHIIVEFQDSHRAKVNTVLQAVAEGSVKNPYDKLILGIGYIGEGIHMAKVDNEAVDEYKRWRNMLSRCYEDKYKDKYTAYYHIATVCEEWHNHQNFADWYCENKYQCNGRLHIDKDILILGNKVYSPDTCLLVPQRINLIFMSYPRTVDADLPVGVRRTLNGKRFYVGYNTKNIGTYDTIEECVELYNKAKVKHIRKVANEQKDILPNKVYESLMNWKPG